MSRTYKELRKDYNEIEAKVFEQIREVNKKYEDTIATYTNQSNVTNKLEEEFKQVPTQQ